MSNDIKALLVPRYKMIADYPMALYAVGDVLTFQEASGDGDCYSMEGSPIGVYSPEKYPAIFKSLEWWEERTEKDVPYVKDYHGRVYKVKKLERHSNTDYGYVHHRGGIGLTSNYQPSPEQEYKAHLK
jgi:hypothetical protein